MQTTATATEKSRYQREVQELKDHLHRANASSDRDSALKEKVFNDAKAEVIALNRKVCFIVVFLSTIYLRLLQMSCLIGLAHASHPAYLQWKRQNNVSDIVLVSLLLTLILHIVLVFPLLTLSK